MENWLFISILILLFTAGLWLHRNSKAALSHKHKSVSSTKPHTNTYQGASIHACSQACEHVSHLQCKRFLASKITQLPVYGCTNPECSCTYVHLDDRRSADDRRYKSTIMESVFSANENRFAKIERRKHSFS